MDRSWNSTATRITAKQWKLEQQISCYIVYKTCKERRSVFPEEVASRSLFSFSFTQHIWQRNNIRLQGSYRFLCPKFKTFSRFFSKTITSFSMQTQDYHIETLNNTGTELFLWCVPNIRVRSVEDFAKRKKIHF